MCIIYIYIAYTAYSQKPRLNALYHYDVEIFQSVLLGPEPDQTLSKFWACNSKTTWFQQHPMLSKLSPDELQWVIPLEEHGDDAELHKRRSFSISTVSSALTVPGSTWDHKLLLSCFDNSMAGESTSTEIDCWICWGLACASAGVYLDHDWHGHQFSASYMPNLYSKAGQRIAGEFRFVFSGHKGDQVYLHKCYKFENYWTGLEVCRSCAVAGLTYQFTRIKPFPDSARCLFLALPRLRRMVHRRWAMFTMARQLCIDPRPLIALACACTHVACITSEALYHRLLHPPQMRAEPMDLFARLCSRTDLGRHTTCPGPGFSTRRMR